jgi:hypothetical protein
MDSNNRNWKDSVRNECGHFQENVSYSSSDTEVNYWNFIHTKFQNRNRISEKKKTTENNKIRHKTARTFTITYIPLILKSLPHRATIWKLDERKILISLQYKDHQYRDNIYKTVQTVYAATSLKTLMYCNYNSSHSVQCFVVCILSSTVTIM